MQTITREIVANILGVSINTIRVWFDGYRFTKYATYTKRENHKLLVYPFTKEFINTLSEYLETTNHTRELRNLKNFLNNGVSLT